LGHGKIIQEYTHRIRRGNVDANQEQWIPERYKKQNIDGMVILGSPT